MKIDVPEPFQRLLGKWQGQGTGQFPTMEPFHYEDIMIFEALGDPQEEPIIRFEEIGWIIDKHTRQFKHWETGFFRILEKGEIQFQVTHNTGRMEIYQGAFETQTSSGSGFELNLNSTLVHNAPELTPCTQAIRQFSLKQGVLQHRLGMSTEEVHGINDHLSVVLKSVS